MRVHGEIEIRRRQYDMAITPASAKEMLQEDFHNLCGYCGKNGRRLRQQFQVDHFVPKSLDSDRARDYSNFVLACPKCNQIKHKKWPTGDKNISHTETIGFLDPAKEEFDQHLCRDDNCNIAGRTPLGKQMCRLLNFHQRLTGLFWKINELCDKRDALKRRYLAGDMSPMEHEYYAQITIFLDELLDALYAKGE